MDGVSLKVTLQDFPQAQAFVRDIIRRGEDRRILLQRIGRYGENSTRARFQDQRGPDGQPWKPSARALAEGGLTLVKTRRLLDDISSESTNDEAVWGTNIPYAGVHQFGATILPRTKPVLKFHIPGVGWRSAKKVTIPARPFVGINREDQAEIADIIEDYYFEGLGGLA